MRGGTANCYVVISDDEIGAPIMDACEDLIVMNDPSLNKFIGKLKPGGTLFINSSIVHSDPGRDDITVVKAPVTEMSLEMGNPKVLNIIMLGVYIGYTEVVSEEVILEGIRNKIGKKNPRCLPLNESLCKRPCHRQSCKSVTFINMYLKESRYRSALFLVGNRARFGSAYFDWAMVRYSSFSYRNRIRS